MILDIRSSSVDCHESGRALTQPRAIILKVIAIG